MCGQMRGWRSVEAMSASSCSGSIRSSAARAAFWRMSASASITISLSGSVRCWLRDRLSYPGIAPGLAELSSEDSGKAKRTSGIVN